MVFRRFGKQEGFQPYIQRLYLEYNFVLLPRDLVWWSEVDLCLYYNTANTFDVFCKLPFLTSFLSCLQIVLENSSREDKHECPFGRSSIELTKMLCEILKVGELRKYPHFPQGMKLGRDPASGGAHLQSGFPRC